MGVKVTNNAYGYLANSLTDIGTLLTLQSGQGSRFPAVNTTDAPATWFRATLTDSSNNREIIKCTVHTAGNDVFGTILRGQDGTTARAWDAATVGGILVEIRPTAGDMDDKLDVDQKDVSGGVAGLTLFKINFKNALNTFTSFFANANTAARTYTFADRDGNVITDADVVAAAAVTPAGADVMPVMVGGVLKKVEWANLKLQVGFPAGTKLVFAQAAAPTGWTQDASNDQVLRVVSGVGGGVGGTLSITSTVTGGHALTAAENGVHAHGVTDPGHAHVQRVYSAISDSGNIPIGYASVGGDVSGPYSTNSSTTGISIQNSAGGAGHDHPLAIKYQDVIICAKN